MTSHTPDQPDDVDLERLRAADPAASAAPDTGALEAAVRDRVPEAFGDRSAVTGEPLSGPGGPTATLVDELAERRARRLRRRAPLQVAAVVAGALVIGAGGYALGAGAVGASPAGDSAVESTALAPFRLGGAGAAQEESGLVPDAAASGQAFSSDARASADMAYPGAWGGRTVFHQDGLSTQGTSADAWAYDAAGVFSQETARRVADVLGVSGEVREEYGTLVVGADGEAQVRLSPDGTVGMSFYDSAKEPWGGADLGAPVSAEAATSELLGVLEALGVDPTEVEVVVEDLADASDAQQGRFLNAYEVVDGRRTGLSWNATFSGAGLGSLYGPLAPRVAIGSYDVVSPAEAVDRLGDPRFGGGGMIAFAREDGTAQAVPEIAPAEPEAPTVPPTVGEGARFAWPVTDVTITDARLGHAVQYQPDGAAVLLPAYELSDADGNVWSVVAVVDDRLDFSPAG
ncbi:hypothetical protein [Cellulosimicrobium sp. 22601]|uniref:hypothetical protein n=1 Tax=unclassified Cellulosimicrobium TaxID=2624466 RepID=UPI003F867051